MKESLKNKIKEFKAELIEHPNKDIFSFKIGYRYFYLDNKKKLTTNFDIDNFLQDNFDFKLKMTSRIESIFYTKNLEDVADKEGWDINGCYTLSDIEREFETEEPIAEIIYDVTISGKKHIIIDDKVYEGEFSVIKNILSISPKQALILLTSEQFVEDFLS